MDVIDLPLEQIIPYARNPRNNVEAAQRFKTLRVIKSRGR